MLVGYCALLVWYQARKKGAAWTDRLEAGAAWRRMAVLLAAGAGAAVAYAAGTPALVEAMRVAFGAFGLVWLPTVSLVLAARAFSRQLRQVG